MKHGKLTQPKNIITVHLPFDLSKKPIFYYPMHKMNKEAYWADGTSSEDALVQSGAKHGKHTSLKRHLPPPNQYFG